MQHRLSTFLPIYPTLSHPDGSAVRALGYSRSGQLIWPVRGGAEDGAGDDGGSGDTGGSGSAGAGDAGESKGGEAKFTQADLDRIVAERVARAKPKDYEEVKAAAKKLAEIEAANASDLEKAVKAAKDEGRAEVQTAANARLVSAEARAVAAEMKFRNPATAVRLLDLSGVNVDDDGEVDSAAVRKLLTDLAATETYLVGGGKPGGSADQGHRESAKPDPSPGRGRLRAAYADSKTT